MSAKQKIESLIVVGVAFAFQWFFMFTKHDPGLRPMIPFGEDPYDALGSMATIVNILVCLLLLWRAFRRYGGQTPSPVRIQYLPRTRAAVLLSILVTLAADAVAMVRHPHMWMGGMSQNKLVAVFIGMMAISASALYLIRSSAPKAIAPHRRGPAITSAIVMVLFLFTLAVYPERLTSHLSTHLLTVLIGDLLLFLPVSVLLRSLLPDPESSDGSQSRAHPGSAYIWIGVTMASLLIGAWLFVAEMTEGGGPMPPLRLRLFVASVYIGLTLAGVLIALAFLRRPLGLRAR